jgi:MYXO-CTERM domain-containing protein
MAALAQAQTVQSITFPAGQMGGTWAAGGCSTAVEKGTSTNSATATMTWTDTTGAATSTVLEVQIQANWKFWCSGGGYSISINGTSLGAGQTPSSTNNCLCNASPFSTSTQTLTSSTFTWNSGGSNTLTFTNTATSWIGVMNGSEGWSVRVSVTVLNGPPGAPTNLHQAAVSGGPGQPLGFVSDSTIYFRGAVPDPDSSNTVGLQAEILPSATPFAASITGTLVSTPSASFVSAGSVAEALLNFTTAGLPSGSYHWRARGVDSFGATGPWGVFSTVAIHFTTDLVPPVAAPGPYAPAGVNFIMEYEPIGDVQFSWGHSFDPSGPPLPVQYRLEVSDTPQFTSLVFDTVTPGTTIQATLPAAEKPYHWRVSAVDAAGNQSVPSEVQVFQLSWTIPPDKDDRYTNCGASMGGGSPWLAAAAVLVALLGLVVRRRS